MSKPLRTFIAVQLSESVQMQLRSLQQSLARLIPDVKWVEDDNLHVTLLFLGDVDTRDTVEICRAVSKVASKTPSFRLTLSGVGCFPSMARPRILWAGISEGADSLTAMHEAIEPKMENLRGYRREERAYSPHATLGRVQGDTDSELIQNAMATKETWQGGTSMIREVLVMSSEITKQGRIYTPIGRAPLSVEADID